MATLWIKELTGGLDARRLPETTSGGLLIRATDGHITRGGDFEKRAAFVSLYDVPDTTTGLAYTSSGGLFVFGSGPAPTLPAGVSYQRLQHPTDAARTLVSVPSWTLYAGKIYAVGVFDNGNVFQYYDGAHVADATTGRFVRTIGSRVTAVSGPNYAGTALNTATAWTTGTGYFTIDMSTQATGSEALTAAAEYQSSVAIFAERVIQIWSIKSDPTQNAKGQTLFNTGTASPRSVTGFGDNDVFYLDESGLRSLRARDSSNAAATSDIGVPVDPLITAKLAALSTNDRAKIVGLIEPGEGRFWLCMLDQIFVFSYFPGAKVSAWTTYTPAYYSGGVRIPFSIDDAVTWNRKVYVRSGTKIFVYGGTGSTLTYDATEAEAWLPYLDANQPTIPKNFEGIDAALIGDWEIRLAFDPNNQNASDETARVFRTTYPGERIGVAHSGTHVSVRFKTTGATAAKLGSIVITFNSAKDAPNAG